MTLYNAGYYLPHRKLFNSFLSGYHLATKMCLFREEVPSTCHDSAPSCPLLSLQQTESAYNSQVRVICSEQRAIAPNGYYILLPVFSGKACLYISFTVHTLQPVLIYIRTSLTGSPDIKVIRKLHLFLYNLLLPSLPSFQVNIGINEDPGSFAHQTVLYGILQYGDVPHMLIVAKIAESWSSPSR